MFPPTRRPLVSHARVEAFPIHTSADAEFPPRRHMRAQDRDRHPEGHRPVAHESRPRRRHEPEQARESTRSSTRLLPMVQAERSTTSPRGFHPARRRLCSRSTRLGSARDPHHTELSSTRAPHRRRLLRHPLSRAPPRQHRSANTSEPTSRLGSRRTFTTREARNPIETTTSPARRHPL